MTASAARARSDVTSLVTAIVKAPVARAPRRQPHEGDRLAFVDMDSQRVRPHLGNRRILHPVNRQKLLAAFLDRDQIQTPPKIFREDVTDLGSRRIMYSLHCQIGALADKVVSLHHLKATVFD